MMAIADRFAESDHGSPSRHAFCQTAHGFRIEGTARAAYLVSVVAGLHALFCYEAEDASPSMTMRVNLLHTIPAQSEIKLALIATRETGQPQIVARSQ
jgi:hypothetical protein